MHIFVTVSELITNPTEEVEVEVREAKAYLPEKF